MDLLFVLVIARTRGTKLLDTGNLGAGVTLKKFISFGNFATTGSSASTCFVRPCFLSTCTLFAFSMCLKPATARGTNLGCFQLEASLTPPVAFLLLKLWSSLLLKFLTKILLPIVSFNAFKYTLKLVAKCFLCFLYEQRILRIAFYAFNVS